VAAAVAVAGHIGQGRATGRLDRAPALDRGRVEQKQIVPGPRALVGEDAAQPLDRLGQAAAALVQGGLAGKGREQVPQLAPGRGEKASVRRDAHERLGDAEGDHLGVCDLPAGVGRAAGQEIIGRAINRDAEGVEVGVHRGLSADGVLGTVDFDPSASNPGSTAMSVESLI
jgi:hypothetical protein